MAANLNLKILPTFATTTTSLNLIHCIESFDAGFNNVYILDENGDYSGFAVTKDSFKKIWKNIDDSLVSVSGIIEQNDNQKILQQSLQIFSKNPQLTEIPILKNNRVVSVITYLLPNASNNFNWHAINDNRLLPEMRDYKKIYLSSLENQDILNFYNCWSTRLPLIPLGNKNLMDSVKFEDDVLLVYAEDFFPDCNKIGIVNLWNKLVVYALKQMMRFCHINQHWASIKQNDSHNLALFIQKFDQGYQAVNIVDESDNFLELVVISTFRDDFPQKNFRKWNNLYVNYSDDEETLKWDIVNWCFGTARKEIPIIRNGKIVASGKIGFGTANVHKGEIFPPVYWDIISDDIAQDFFGDKRKILISSNYGNLNGFRKRFGNMLNITVYDDSLLEKYLSDEFDMLIYGSDVWCETSTIKYSAQQIYATLLGEQVRRYLEKRNVNFYLLEYYEEILNLNKKIKFSDVDNVSIHFDGIYNDYYVQEIKVKKSTEQFTSTIYFFGHCPIPGTFAAYEHSIESYLQEIMNEKNLSIRVLNKGVAGGFPNSSINHLYQIMDMNFKSGDIVILLNHTSMRFSMWRIAFRNYLSNHIYLTDAFYKNKSNSVKPFRDCSKSHLNAEGNRIVAEFLWEKLCDKLSKKIENTRQIIPSLFSITPPPPSTSLEYGIGTARLFDCA